MNWIRHFLPEISGIPVLMFHRLHPSEKNFLSVTTSDFHAQLSWLKQEGYQSISMDQFLAFISKRKFKSELPAKPFLITFDDGYQSTLELGMPELLRFGFNACIFVTSSYIQKGAPYLSIEELKTWTGAGMELALHSHTHPNYRDSSLAQIESDLKENIRFFKENQLSYQSVLAYPFGARPQEPLSINAMKKMFAQQGIKAAFRIGNRIHSLKNLISDGLDHFELCRIDIRGDESFDLFQCRVKKGKVKLF